MAVKSPSLAPDAAVSFTGGTPADFQVDGLQVQNGVHLTNVNESFRERTGITVKSRASVYDNVRKTFSKSKKEVAITVPTVDSVTQSITYNTLRLSLDHEPQIDDDKIDRMLTLACQVLEGNDFRNFWLRGSIE